MSEGSSQSRRASISLSLGNGTPGGSGGQFGRFTGRLDEQERELRELKEEYRCLAQKLVSLEKWKTMVEAWVMDYFGETLGSEEEAHDDNNEPLENGRRDEHLSGSLLYRSHTPEGEEVFSSEVGDAQVDSSDVGGSMAVGVGGRRSRSPRKELESPQRKRSKRDSEGSGVTVMIPRSSPTKKTVENEVVQVQPLFRSEDSRIRSPKAGTMLRAMGRKSSPAVRNSHAGKNQKKDSDTDESMENGDNGVEADTTAPVTPKTMDNLTSPPEKKSGTLWKLKPFRSPFVNKKKYRSSKVDKERAEAAVTAVTDATAYEFLGDDNEEIKAGETDEKDGGVVTKKGNVGEASRNSGSDIELLDDDEDDDEEEKEGLSRTRKISSGSNPSKDTEICTPAPAPARTPTKRPRTGPSVTKKESKKPAVDDDDDTDEDPALELPIGKSPSPSKSATPIKRKKDEVKEEKEETENLKGTTANTAGCSNIEDENDEDVGDPCAVCNEPWWDDDDMIIFCEKCDVAVHQVCYGVPELPVGKWFCKPCSQGLKPEDLECILCSHKGGALKNVLTPKKDKWAHVHCAQWIPNVAFGNHKKLEPVVGIDKVEKARWKLLCRICKVKKGAPIQCSDKRCKVAFHPFCAKKEGLYLNMEDPGGDADLIMTAYCQGHTPNEKANKKMGKKKATKKKRK